MKADMMLRGAEDGVCVWQEVFSRPTFKRFYDLLDNYVPQQGVAEAETQQVGERLDCILLLGSCMNRFFMTRSDHFDCRSALR